MLPFATLRGWDVMIDLHVWGRQVVLRQMESPATNDIYEIEEDTTWELYSLNLTFRSKIN